MKKLIFFLLFTVSFYGQTLQNPTFGIVTEKNNATDSAPAYFTTTQVDGVHKKTPAANVEKTANKSDSYTASSSITYASTKALVDGLGTKQEIIFVTPDQFGAVGDGVTDDSTAFQNFLNSTLPKKILADKIYKIETELIINNPNNLDFNNSTLTSATLLRLLTIKSSDVYISNGNFISNMTGDYTVITEIEPYANSWLIGCKLVTGEFFENINIINSHFSTPSGSLNAVKLISHRSGFGGELKHINIKNNRFEEIGRMAVEVLGEGTTEWYSHVNISNNYFNNLGNYSIYGMAVSLSGLGTENIISENTIEQAKDVCIENAGANNTIISNNTIKNPKSGATPATVNSAGSGVKGLNNIFINNTFYGTYARGFQFLYQDKMISSNNYIDSASNLTQLQEVSNSIFTSDIYSSTGFPSVLIHDNSYKNKFDKCVFDNSSSPSYQNNVVCQISTTTGNYFTNCNFINPSSGGNSLFQDTGVSGNFIEKQVLKDNLTTLAAYNITDGATITQLNLKQNILTNPITGTGTTNYLPKFNGTTTQLASRFFDDGTTASIASSFTLATDLKSSTSNLILSDTGGGIFRGVRANAWTDNLSSRFLQVGTTNDNVIISALSATNASRLMFLASKTQFTSGGYPTASPPIGLFEILYSATNVALSVATTGETILNKVPTTSAGTYDFLTRNIGTGVVEKITSASVAPIASPTFTGTPTAPTATAGTNTTQIATTAFVLANSSSGTYTPTLTNTTNITSSTLNAAYYVRNGNIITVTIAVQLTLTATADTVFTFSLPVSGATVVNGVGQGNLTSGGGSVNAYGIVDTTNSTTAQLRIGSAAVAGSGAGVANIIFTYSL